MISLYPNFTTAEPQQTQFLRTETGSNYTTKQRGIFTELMILTHLNF